MRPAVSAPRRLRARRSRRSVGPPASAAAVAWRLRSRAYGTGPERGVAGPGRRTRPHPDVKNSSHVAPPDVAILVPTDASRLCAGVNVSKATPRPAPGRVQLNLVLGQPRSKVGATPLKGLRAPVRPLMDRVILAPVRRRPHRERVLPARHVRLQLGGRRLELRSHALGHPLIEPDRSGRAATDCARRCGRGGRLLARGRRGSRDSRRCCSRDPWQTRTPRIRGAP